MNRFHISGDFQIPIPSSHVTTYHLSDFATSNHDIWLKSPRCQLQTKMPPVPTPSPMKNPSSPWSSMPLPRAKSHLQVRPTEAKYMESIHQILQSQRDPCDLKQQFIGYVNSSAFLGFLCQISNALLAEHLNKNCVIHTDELCNIAQKWALK